VALYTQDSIERLKQAIDIVEIVGARTELRRVGARFTGLCPFHEERTPSFSVNPELSLFHCFGCQESGDAIGFVQKTEAMDFREAVELLADRYGVELKKEDEDPKEEERRRLRERLLGLLDRTTDFYARYLWESGEAGPARDYLRERGRGEEVLKAFRVGYSPSAWDKVLVAARRDGYTEEELAGKGLGVRGRQGGKFYDRFRGRIMFPLADQRGKVVGFGAREMKKQEGMPKYLNTSENSIFHKSRQLYGLHLARASAAKAGRIVVVEGYTDVLALHQAGVPETVAIMGTSLTEEQMAELARAATTIFLALDADGPGQEAMLKASRMASTRDVELRVIVLPEGKDPAELVADGGPEAFTGMFAKAMSVPEFEVRRELSKGDLGSARGRDTVLEHVRPLIGLVPERSAARDELVRQVADRLDVPTSYVVGDGKVPPPRPRREAASPTPGGGDPGPEQPGGLSPVDALLRAERDFLAMCVAQADAARPYLERLTDDHLSTGGLRRLRAHLAGHLSDPLTDLPSDDPELVALAGEIVMLADEEPTSQGALRLGFLQLDLRRLDRALRTARASRDFEVQRELYAEREQARAEMDEVMGEAL
jgi:DNA primase